MTVRDLTRVRSAGVLLHPTGLPGPHGCGDLGAEARRFVDFLARARQHWWQMLPIHPPGKGDSPYNALSAFAGSALLISLDDLRRDGLLTRAETSPGRALPSRAVDFPATWRLRNAALRVAYERAMGRARWRSALEDFRAREADWVEHHAVYRALHRAYRGQPWYQWDAPLRRRNPAAVAAARNKLADEISLYTFIQLLFERQWQALRAYAAERKVALLGDVPIFVAHDSADLWAHQEQFFLNGRGMPTVVAGVPPDAFSRTGQRWGNPLYRWDLMREGGYRWWLDRLAMAARRFDIVRLDHFIGFQRYWEIKATAPTAMKGRFRPGPRDAFFRAVRKAEGGLPFVAEDLGIVTPEVTALRERFGLPGLRVLQFAFDGDPQRNPHLPHLYPRHCVVYTGTHDNDTTQGWYRGASPQVRRRVLDYAGGDAGGIHQALIRLAHASVADLAIVPLQDVLGLGVAARMNTPGTPRGNWVWRFQGGALRPQLADWLGEVTAGAGRAASRWPEPTPEG
jgi:4-alpha-glucanotransferase